MWMIERNQTKEFTDAEYADYPCLVSNVAGSIVTEAGSTSYVFAMSAVEVKSLGECEVLTPYQSMSIPGTCHIRGTCVVIQRLAFTAISRKCWGIESRGRLNYIDGCTDTILLHPDVVGDPVLNHLHFPVGIDQTMHTHPSLRAGVVAKGRGVCRTPEGDFTLKPGVVWYLPIDAQHAFKTEDSTLDVIAFHPDSDQGPQHQNHPMLNRTIVGGVSAKDLPGIQTKL